MRKGDKSAHEAQPSKPGLSNRLRQHSGRNDSLDFKRTTGSVYRRPRNWIDKTLPTCPLCRSPSLREVGVHIGLTETRYYFRCPNCQGVLSIREGAIVPVIWRGNTDFRVEDAGSNSAMKDIVAKEYPIKTLQEWATNGRGPHSDPAA